VISRVAAIDAALAVIIAAVVLIVSPGLAVTGIIALAVLVVCGISFAWSARRRRHPTRTVKKSRL
jgi:ABC-type bacteriocin/lantibiotic exporter with double-glycine peptidase domain